MVETLSGRLILHAKNAEQMRERYRYRGNAKYPRPFPSPYWKHFDDLARDLREAAKIVDNTEGSA